MDIGNKLTTRTTKELLDFCFDDLGMLLIEWDRRDLRLLYFPSNFQGGKVHFVNKNKAEIIFPSASIISYNFF